MLLIHCISNNYSISRNQSPHTQAQASFFFIKHLGNLFLNQKKLTFKATKCSRLCGLHVHYCSKVRVTVFFTKDSTHPGAKLICKHFISTETHQDHKCVKYECRFKTGLCNLMEKFNFAFTHSDLDQFFVVQGFFWTIR